MTALEPNLNFTIFDLVMPNAEKWRVNLSVFIKHIEDVKIIDEIEEDKNRMTSAMEEKLAEISKEHAELKKAIKEKSEIEADLKDDSELFKILEDIN